MKKIILSIGFLILIISINHTHAASTSASTDHRGIVDYLATAAHYIYQTEYDEYVAGTDYLLGCIINETISLSYKFASAHATQMLDIRYIFLAIRYELPGFINNYEYSYGCSLPTIRNLHTALHNTWGALYYTQPASWLLYDQPLESIIDYLEHIVYEIRRPIPHVNSLEYVAHCLSSIVYLFNSIRYP